jgi:hypothetical protein
MNVLLTWFFCAEQSAEKRLHSEFNNQMVYIL